MKRMLVALAVLAAIPGEAVAEECPDGAIFKFQGDRPGELVLIRQGSLRAPLVQDSDALVPAFALQFRTSSSEIRYAWGPMRSYVFAATEELLNQYSVEWSSEPVAAAKGDFFRFMDDSGQEILLIIEFDRCR